MASRKGEKNAGDMEGAGLPARGDSPLHYSAMIGSVECVQMLVRLKADLNRPSTRHGETPLHKAVLFGRTEVVEELLAAGASTKHANDRGFSPVQLCELCGEDATAAAFRLHGCVVNSCTVATVMSGAVSKASRPELLWEVISALYLYKRPRRARSLLSELLVAAHSAGYPVQWYAPQLCDLALREPPGDIAVKQALISLALTAPILAFSLAFYVYSVSDSNPVAAKNFCEVLETVVFGGSIPASAPVSHSSSFRGEAEAAAAEGAALDTQLLTASLERLERKSSAKNLQSQGGLTPLSRAGASDTGTPRARRETDPPRPDAASASADWANQSSASLGERTPDASTDFLQQYGQQRCSWSMAETPRERRSMLLKCRKFLKVLRELGSKLPLVTPAVRGRELQGAMEKINERLPPCLYVPLFVGENKMFWVLSILSDEAKVFSTNTRAPFSFLAEIKIIENKSKAVDEVGSKQSALTRQTPELETIDQDSPFPHEENKHVHREGEEEEERNGTFSEWLQEGEHAERPPHLPASKRQNDQEALLDRIFGESWDQKRERIRAGSAHGDLPNWELVAYIAKSGDDLRQEQFAMQLIEHFADVFARAGTNLWLQPYQIVATASDAGLIQIVPDSVSLHSLREKWARLSGPTPAESSLAAFFCAAYGSPDTPSHKMAQQNFIESMAAYAVVCYLLKVKDRNDGNLLLTRKGHIVHIDFGYLISNSPGDIAFEQAPFKLTSELVDIMGGKDSSSFRYFRELCVEGFLEARKPHNHQKILMLVEMMANGVGGELGIPCVSGQAPADLVNTLKSLYMLGRSEDEVRSFVHGLIDESIDNWYTKQYDYFQVLQKRWTNLFT